jgi:hypothetical protein
LGEFDAAERALDAGLRIFDAHADMAGVVRALDVLAYLWIYRGEHERARSFVDDGLRLARDLGGRREIAAHLGGLAILNKEIDLLTSIYTKLGVNSRSAATRFAIEHGPT